MFRLFIILCISSVLSVFSSVYAADVEVYEISIRNHEFHPSEITVPAGKKIRFIVKNEDSTPEEFESEQLHREKIINGGKTAKITFGPLEAGKIYNFFGEFHEDTAQGRIIVE